MVPLLLFSLFLSLSLRLFLMTYRHHCSIDFHWIDENMPLKTGLQVNPSSSGSVPLPPPSNGETYNALSNISDDEESGLGQSDQSHMLTE